jgi:hypothetical protein
VGWGSEANEAECWGEFLRSWLEVGSNGRFEGIVSGVDSIGAVGGGEYGELPRVPVVGEEAT